MFGLDTKTFENLDNKVLVHKVNCQDLTTHSYVIVDESQEVLMQAFAQRFLYSATVNVLVDT